MMRAALLLLTSVQLLIAQPAATGVFDLKGHVVDSTTGAPVPYSRVTVNSGGREVSLLTDASGLFQIAGVPRGYCSVRAEHGRYAATRDSLRSFMVDEKTDPPAVELRLMLPPLIKGVVLDADGHPMQSVQVAVVRRIIARGKATLVVAMSNTDDRGEFRATNFGLGKTAVCVLATASPYQLRHDRNYPLSCYPGNTELSSAEWIDMQAGQEREIRMRLALVQGVRLSGIISGYSGQTQTSLYLQRTDISGRVPLLSTHLRFDPKTARFEGRGVLPGTYAVMINMPEFGSRAIAEIVVGNEDLAGLNLVIPPPSVVTGTFRTEAGVPPDQPLNIAFLSEEVNQQAGAIINADGTFRTSIQVPGTYEVQVFSRRGYHVERLLLAGRDVTDERIAVTIGSSTGPLDVVLGSSEGTVAVSLPAQQKELPNLTLLRKRGNQMSPLAADPVWITPAPTDAAPQAAMPQPQARFDHVPPGDYVLYVWPPGSEVEYANPDVLRTYESYGIPVTVTDGKTTSVSAKVLALN